MTAKEFADKLDRMTLPEIMNAINSQTAEKNGLTVIVPDGDGIVRFYGVHNENIQIDFTGYASAFITKKKIVCVATLDSFAEDLEKYKNLQRVSMNTTPGGIVYITTKIPHQIFRIVEETDDNTEIRGWGFCMNVRDIVVA